MTSDYTVQCPDCGALPGARCQTGKAEARVHFSRRVKGGMLLKRPDLAAKVSDWTDTAHVAEICRDANDNQDP